MVIGPFINASAVLLGGVLGALLSQRLPERIRVSMTSIFGLASLGIGILLVVKCANLPAMVLATLTWRSNRRNLFAGERRQYSGRQSTKSVSPLA